MAKDSSVVLMIAVSSRVESVLRRLAGKSIALRAVPDARTARTLLASHQHGVCAVVVDRKVCDASGVGFAIEMRQRFASLHVACIGAPFDTCEENRLFGRGVCPLSDDASLPTAMRRFLSECIARRDLARGVAERAVAQTAMRHDLSPQVAHLLAETLRGTRRAALAPATGMSERAVRSHISRALEQTGHDSWNELVIEALRDSD